MDGSSGDGIAKLIANIVSLNMKSEPKQKLKDIAADILSNQELPEDKFML